MFKMGGRCDNRKWIDTVKIAKPVQYPGKARIDGMTASDVEHPSPDGGLGGEHVAENVLELRPPRIVVGIILSRVDKMIIDLHGRAPRSLPLCRCLVARTVLTSSTTSATVMVSTPAMR